MLATGNFSHSTWWDIFEPDAEDNDGLLRRAGTAASEEQSPSAGHHALAVTDHVHTSESHWSDVLQHSEQTATCMWLSSVQKQNWVAVIHPQYNKSMKQCVNWLNVQWSTTKPEHDLRHVWQCLSKLRSATISHQEWYHLVLSYCNQAHLAQPS